MKTAIAYVVVLVLIAISIFAFEKYSKPVAVPPSTPTDSNTPLPETAAPVVPTADATSQDSSDITAQLNTNFGVIELTLYTKDAPKTISNFTKLAKDGFYNGTKFHRVIKGFMIQGGDPNSKDNDWSNDGMGGPGYKFDDEISSHKFVRGTLAMANSGPNTNGSQFFILTAANLSTLDGHYTIFGKVTKGMDVVDKIENLKTQQCPGGHSTPTCTQDHPLTDAIVNEVRIIKTISIKAPVTP